VAIDADRQSGVVYQIDGRDRLGPVVDGIADPRRQYKAGLTLEGFLHAEFFRYGWNRPEHFVIDNSANRDAKTGGIRGVPMSKGGKKHGPKPLKSFVLHQLQPYQHETVFAFVSRVAQRFGLWIWCSGDGKKLIVGKPDFDQPPRYFLQRNDHGGLSGTNVLGGTVKYDMSDQPSVIIADAFGGGGEFGKSRHKCYCVNPYFGYDANGQLVEGIQELIDAYPGATAVRFDGIQTDSRRMTGPYRPLVLHDQSSQTQEQLEGYVRREMSLLLRKSLTANYTVEGHGQLDSSGNFTAWDVDTVVTVQDEVAGVNENMYVLGRTFEKSRSSGTHTKLELIRLNSIQF
jgi:prophage tail gpP-like protein